MLCNCTALIYFLESDVTCLTRRPLRSIDLQLLTSLQKSDLLKHNVNLHTCDCTSPFSVTAQCVDADISKNISNSRRRIFHFIFIIFFYCSLILLFILRTEGKNVTDGNIMNIIPVKQNKIYQRVLNNSAYLEFSKIHLRK
jgi:cbb3-type cytochrome oxidase subunit 3